MSSSNNKPKLVKVEWEDAGCRDQGPWVFKKKKWKYKPYLVTEVGFLLYEGEEGILLTNAINQDQTGPVTQIPITCIRSLRELR